MIEISCVITGKVQGVRYRDYIQTAACELKLTGFVRNLSDGTVSVVAQGEPETLKEFVEYLHEGSLQAEVEGVAVEWRTTKRQDDDFSIKF